VTEKELQRRVEAQCSRRGLLWHHCRDPRLSCRGSRGFPDLVIAGPGGVIFTELKADDGDTSAGQDAWIWTLTASGAIAVVMRPADLATGRITERLEEIR
jgi:hypothetical protein